MHDSIKLEILPVELLEPYCQQVRPDLQNLFDKLTDAEISTDTFSFYTSVSSVFSSKIEGEDIALDSFVKHRRFGVEFQPNYTRKTDDLYNAYIFAQQSKLNRENVEEAHRILTQHILSEHQQGKIRTSNMYVLTNDGRIEYVAASPYALETELQKLYTDIDTLLSAKLNTTEAFFFASMLHLVFVKIHPFSDGNGRISRLLEKWFLAEKLGKKVWHIQSEKYYYEQHQTYFNNIRALGLEYESLDYDKAMPFLLMLPDSLVTMEI